jgi:thiol-disulfide isomerase/thioredoxin
MRVFATVLLYLSLAFGANAGASELEALRDGQMKKLQFHTDPALTSTKAFLDSDDSEKTLAEYQGRIVVLNFWATWCAPCRKEMPSLARLQDEFSTDELAVVTLAVGRNSPTGIRKFFDEIGVQNLPHYRDKRQGIASDMGVLGLPVTVILDREGLEIARLIGDAEWDTDSAKAIVSALVAGES